MTRSPLKASVGFPARFYCDSHGKTRWFYNKQRLPKNAFGSYRLGRKFLNIVPVEYSNGGKYYCYGFDEGIYPFVASAVLQVYGKFKFQ